jgi:choline dehydrogenase-like flavoprotein
MDDPPAFDILIVGSGPSGVQAAVEATRLHAKVALLDIGHTEDRFSELIPPDPFWKLRQSDPKQSEYLLGDPSYFLESQSRPGANLTPPRLHMLRGAHELFPVESSNFVPLQSTSAGGMGVSWGANVFTYSATELERIGLPPEAMSRYYSEVAADIGVSGCAHDDTRSRIAGAIPLQPPLPLDSNARSILRNYERARTQINRHGLALGQSAMAILSQPLGERQPNPLTDMDYYGDAGQSVYRPQRTLGELRRLPNFHYFPQRLALAFDEPDSGVVRLLYRDLTTNHCDHISARRLVLAAGAINSGKLALNSLSADGGRLGILSNENIWIAAINLSMLGREAADARYSLSQLAAVVDLDDPKYGECAVAQFFSFRSLLYSRMLDRVPLPPALGLLFLRLIATAFTCVNVHFPDVPDSRKFIELKGKGEHARLHASYDMPPEQQCVNRRTEKKVRRSLRWLKCLTLGVIRPVNGTSIHYAGTLPFSKTARPFTCDSTARLHRTAGVYVADGSTWNFLPGQGLTFTLMANARRVAQDVVESLSR